MHDLIEEMGEQIVREESPNYPEKRSRLNDSKEIFYVLKNNMGTKKIQGITVDVAQIKEVRLRADTFTKMRKLRIIKFYASYGWRMESQIKLPHNLQSFSDDLRYFRWDAYPSKSLPLGFCLENLVELHMEYNNMQKLWDGVQDLPNLETINLSRSQQLMELPDFSMTRKLETVYLDFCENLRSVHPSILSHTLVNLDVSYCSKLETLESMAHLKSLSELRANGCSSLKKFCLSLERVEQLDLQTSKIEILHLPIRGQFTELRGLYLNGSRLRSLPIDELCCLTNLESFQLDDFCQVIHKTELEILFAAWPCLTRLCLNNCSKLSEIPDNISALTELETLSLRGSAVEVLPAFFRHLSNLRNFFFPNCRKLRSILGLPLTLVKLEATDCTSLETIFCSSRLQQQLLDHIFWLNLKNCGKFDEPSLDFIEKLSQCSIISAYKKVDFYYTACYSGSRVPNWMRYKQMAMASNTVEFTCDDEQSLIGMAFCCVLPPTPMEVTLCCNYSDDNNLKFMSEYLMRYYDWGGYNSDHVFMWYHKFTKSDARASYHGRIVCKFSAALRGIDNVVIMGSDVSIKECGVCPVLSLDRKRKRDAHVYDLASLLKQKYRPELQVL